MKHPDHDSLSAFLDNEISDELHRHIQSHITECSSCAVLVESLRTARERVQDVESVELPDTFASNVSTKVRSRMSQENEWSVIEKMAEKVLTGIAVVVVMIFITVTLLDLRDPASETRTAGLFDLYIRDSTVANLVTAESITRDDVLAAALTHEEGLTP